MKKAELEVKVQDTSERTPFCRACLTEQRKNRKIDDETHNERLFELTIRDFVCAYCKHVDLAQDEDHTVCADCGTLQDAEVG